jgi:hypothetical protein
MSRQISNEVSRLERIDLLGPSTAIVFDPRRCIVSRLRCRRAGPRRGVRSDGGGAACEKIAQATIYRKRLAMDTDRLDAGCFRTTVARRPGGAGSEGPPLRRTPPASECIVSRLRCMRAGTRHEFVPAGPGPRARGSLKLAFIVRGLRWIQQHRVGYGWLRTPLARCSAVCADTTLPAQKPRPPRLRRSLTSACHRKRLTMDTATPSCL